MIQVELKLVGSSPHRFQWQPWRFWLGFPPATCIVSKWIQVATLPWPSWKWKNVVRFTFYLEKIPILTAMFQAPASYWDILFQTLVVGWPSCWRDGVDRDNFSSSYDMVDPTWGRVFSSKSFAAGSLEWFWRWCSEIRNPTFWDICKYLR